MVFNSDKLGLNKIKHIGYYRLKSLSKPYLKNIDGTKKFENLNFKIILNKYLQDKYLRIYLLSAIEDIEVSLGNQLAYTLSRKLGAFGYLDFSESMDKQSYSKDKIQEEEKEFQDRILRKLKNQNDINFNYADSCNEQGFPTVWLVINLLTFEELVYLIKLMSQSNKTYLARFYRCRQTCLSNGYRL